jgi:hypothetical protein
MRTMPSASTRTITTSLRAQVVGHVSERTDLDVPALSLTVCLVQVIPPVDAEGVGLLARELHGL